MLLNLVYFINNKIICKKRGYQFFKKESIIISRIPNINEKKQCLILVKARTPSACGRNSLGRANSNIVR